MASLAAVFALIWSLVDDSLFYASMGLCAVGMGMLWKVAQESREHAVALALMLLVPIAIGIWVFSTLE